MIEQRMNTEDHHITNGEEIFFIFGYTLSSPPKKPLLSPVCLLGMRVLRNVLDAIRGSQQTIGIFVRNFDTELLLHCQNNLSKE
jgi:hypothetical protein